MVFTPRFHQIWVVVLGAARSVWHERNRSTPSGTAFFVREWSAGTRKTWCTHWVFLLSRLYEENWTVAYHIGDSKLDFDHCVWLVESWNDTPKPADLKKATDWGEDLRRTWVILQDLNAFWSCLGSAHADPDTSEPCGNPIQARFGMTRVDGRSNMALEGWSTL